MIIINTIISMHVSSGDLQKYFIFLFEVAWHNLTLFAQQRKLEYYADSIYTIEAES